MTTQITQDLSTEGQNKQIKRFIEDAANSVTIDDIVKLGFSKESAQEIIKNGNILQSDVKTAVIESLKKLSIIDKRFGVPFEFEVIVPADYDHDTQIDTFGKRVRKEKTTYYYNDDFTSKNFAKATNKLEPGKKYRVKLFPVLETVTSIDCMNFLRKQNAILAGGQGVTLVYDQAKDKLPKDKWAVSFDEKDALWKDADGSHRVPYVFAYSDGDFEFALGYFGRDWLAGDCLVCFCDLPAETGK